MGRGQPVLPARRVSPAGCGLAWPQGKPRALPRRRCRWTAPWAGGANVGTPVLLGLASVGSTRRSCAPPLPMPYRKLTVVRRLRTPERSPTLTGVRSVATLSLVRSVEEGVGGVHSPYSVVVGSFDPPLLFPFALLLPQWNPLSATDHFLFLLLRSFSTQNSSVPLPLVALTRETSDEPKSPS